MIESNPEGALEVALNKADANVLEFVCSKNQPGEDYHPRKHETQSEVSSLARPAVYSVAESRPRFEIPMDRARDSRD
uniref:Uncharacterized protein n=1 Tax=Caenorhabditis japonica TaxID=281687 RepID=A0A8R1EJ40_CAEJA